MTDDQKLELGIEIVSAMKASAYGVPIEDGRIMALQETEVDRMEGVTPEYWKSLSDENMAIFTNIAAFEKKRLHKRAMFVADIALKRLEQLKL